MGVRFYKRPKTLPETKELIREIAGNADCGDVYVRGIGAWIDEKDFLESQSEDIISAPEVAEAWGKAEEFVREHPELRDIAGHNYWTFIEEAEKVAPGWDYSNALEAPILYHVARGEGIENIADDEDIVGQYVDVSTDSKRRVIDLIEYDPRRKAFVVTYKGVNADEAFSPSMSLDYPTLVIFCGEYVGTNQYGDGYIVVPEEVVAVVTPNPPMEGAAGDPRDKAVKERWFSLPADQAVRTFFAYFSSLNDTATTDFVAKGNATEINRLDGARIIDVATTVKGTGIPRDVGATIVGGKPTEWRKLERFDFYDDAVVAVFPGRTERYDIEGTVGASVQPIEDMAERYRPITVQGADIKRLEDFLKGAQKEVSGNVKGIYIDFTNGVLAYQVGETVELKKLQLARIRVNDEKAIGKYNAAYLLPFVHEVRMAGARSLKLYPTGETDTPLFVVAEFKDGSVLKFAQAPIVAEGDSVIEYFLGYGKLPESLRELEGKENERYLQRIKELETKYNAKAEKPAVSEAEVEALKTLNWAGTNPAEWSAEQAPRKTRKRAEEHPAPEKAEETPTAEEKAEAEEGVSEECDEPRFIEYEPRPDGGVRIKYINIGDKRKAKTSAWAKVVTSVDVSAKGGYAFEGQFLPYTRETDVPNGSWVVVSRADGSWRHPHNTIYLIHVRDGKMCVVEEADWPDEQLSFKERAAELVNKHPPTLENVEGERGKPEAPKEAPPVEERPPEKAEESPLEACTGEKEKLLWQVYEAEFRLKGLKAEKPAWLRGLAEQVCREEMTMPQALAETLRRAKIDIANEIYRRVVGKRTEEVVELEKPPAEEKGDITEEIEVPVEEHGEVIEEPLEEAVEEAERPPTVADIEEKLTVAVRRFARAYGDPEAFIEALPIPELAHAVIAGRISLEDAEEFLRMAIVEGRKPGLLAAVDWEKVIGKRGKVDIYRAEEKFLDQLEKLRRKAERELERRMKQPEAPSGTARPAPKEAPEAYAPEAPKGGLERNISGAPPGWLEDELRKPQSIWLLIDTGAEGFVNYMRARHPGIEQYYHGIYEFAKELLGRVEERLKMSPNKPVFAQIALHMLETDRDLIAARGLRGFYKSEFPAVISLMLHDLDGYGRKLYQLYRAHPWVYWKEAGGHVFVGWNGGTDTYRVPTGNVVVRIVGLSMLKALGLNPEEATGRVQYELLIGAFKLMAKEVSG